MNKWSRELQEKSDELRLNGNPEDDGGNFSRRVIEHKTVIGAQGKPEQRPPLAEEIFKNVQILKGIPVDQFMGTMVFFPLRLGSTAPTATPIKAVATGRGTPTTTRVSRQPDG
jgi:hypothetical protein